MCSLDGFIDVSGKFWVSTGSEWGSFPPGIEALLTECWCWKMVTKFRTDSGIPILFRKSLPREVEWGRFQLSYEFMIPRAET